MRAIFFPAATLAGIWWVLSGSVSAFFLGCGAFSCALTLVAARKMKIAPPVHTPLYLRPAAIPYALWLFAQMLLSALAVMRAVWRLKPAISPTLAWVPSRLKSDRGQAAYATSITLTPGTVCTGVANNNVQVHALHSGGIAELRRHRMEKKIERLAGND